MKKILLGLLMSFLFTSVCFAQMIDSRPTMKVLAIEGMHDYAKAQFDRRNYLGAVEVYKRILFYDPCNRTAFNYLHRIKAKGVHVSIPHMPNCAEEDQTQKPLHMGHMSQKADVAPKKSFFGTSVTPKTSDRQMTESSASMRNPTHVPMQMHANEMMMDTSTAAIESTGQDSSSQAMMSSDNISNDLSKLQEDLHRLRESLHEQASRLNSLEGQLP